jgi:hypothetical protein
VGSWVGPVESRSSLDSVSSRSQWRSGQVLEGSWASLGRSQSTPGGVQVKSWQGLSI